MELIKYESPFDASEVLDLIEEIFGKGERELETPQLNGDEAEHNRDIVYVAKNKDTLLGMIHATIPTRLPFLGGVSAMCTTEAARGKGVGRILFEKIVEEMDAAGVRYSLLGTGNPIAAKLYSSCGYSYLPLSGVMIRLAEGGVVDFNRKLYSEPKGRITVSEGGAEMRIPLIPLALLRENHEILDANVELIRPGVYAQSYCMSLYPRYIDLKKRGGKYFAACDDDGVLGGVASICPDSEGNMRADYFTAKGFAASSEALVAAATKDHPEAYFEVGEGDGVKLELLRSLGYREHEHRHYRHRGTLIPTVIMKK